MTLFPKTLLKLVLLLLVTATLAAAQPAYRTFLQSDLAEKKARAGKVLAASSCFSFVDTVGTATSLHVKFNAEIVSIQDSGGFTILVESKRKTLHATGRIVSPGDTVKLCLTFARKNLNVHTNFWYWDTNGVRFGPKYGEMAPTSASAIQVQPNGGNVRDFLYKFVVTRPAGLVVGVPDTGHGWIRYKTADRKYFPHGGPPRCFDLITNGEGNTRPFDHALKNPHVKKHDNHLLGEVHALKLAVLANDAGVTMPDTPATRLGDILYNDPANPGDPCNGKTARGLLAIADSALTYCERYAPDFYPHLDSCITRINAAFSGPYTAVTFSPFLLAGTHTIAEYPFLHDNPSIPPVLLPGERASVIEAAPQQFVLEQNYPNPFNPSTKIDFRLPVESIVTLKVYNLLGQELASLAENELMSEGDQSIEFNASRLTSGVYFYKISAHSAADETQVFQAIRRMVLVK